MKILALTFKVRVVLNGELEPLEAVVLQPKSKAVAGSFSPMKGKRCKLQGSA